MFYYSQDVMNINNKKIELDASKITDKLYKQ